MCSRARPPALKPLCIISLLKLPLPLQEASVGVVAASPQPGCVGSGNGAASDALQRMGR